MMITITYALAQRKFQQSLHPPADRSPALLADRLGKGRMPHAPTLRSGYVYLLTVLFIGIIALSVVGTYLVLSISTLQNGITIENAAQALANAHTCAERGLLHLQNDANYGGEEVFTLSKGTCEILKPVGSGNDNRSLCAEGIFGDSTRRVEIVISQLLPSLNIFSWQEVATFIVCSY